MQISFKIDEDNDLYELTVDNKVYTIYDVYDTKQTGKLWDDLNMLVDEHL